jgi:hypothetical protein
MIQTTDLIANYVATWNEADPALRCSALSRLYAGNGRIVTASVEARGIREIGSHISQVVTNYIGADKYRFRQAGVTSHHDCVLLRWEMVAADTGQVADWGVNALLLDTDGRIQDDYQFVAPDWPS